mmetsp:Transcript_9116/g.12756  ORF Transcript_9116/g.12756 Transcript_9116/m.12756 type:complete len:201 (-) Transcript_9116:41-643(-)
MAGLYPQQDTTTLSGLLQLRSHSTPRKLLVQIRLQYKLQSSLHQEVQGPDDQRDEGQPAQRGQPLQDYGVQVGHQVVVLLRAQPQEEHPPVDREPGQGHRGQQLEGEHLGQGGHGADAGVLALAEVLAVPPRRGQGLGGAVRKHVGERRQIAQEDKMHGNQGPEGLPDLVGVAHVSERRVSINVKVFFSSRLHVWRTFFG